MSGYQVIDWPRPRAAMICHYHLFTAASGSLLSWVFNYRHYRCVTDDIDVNSRWSGEGSYDALIAVIYWLRLQAVQASFFGEFVAILGFIATLYERIFLVGVCQYPVGSVWPDEPVPKQFSTKAVSAVANWRHSTISRYRNNVYRVALSLNNFFRSLLLPSVL